MLDTVLISKEYFKITFHGHTALVGLQQAQKVNNSKDKRKIYKILVIAI